MTEHADGRIRNDEGADDSASDAESSPLELEKDLVFELLKNHRRRSVLKHLRDHGETPLGDLAEAIAAEENETTVADLSADERKRVYIGLYQTHLPKMDGAGVVNYDQNRGLVSSGPAIDQLLRYIEAGADEDESAVSAAVVSRLDLSPLRDPVSLPGWGLVATVLVAGLLTYAATALPDPGWAVVLVLAASAATWLVQWE